MANSSSDKKPNPKLIQVGDLVFLDIAGFKWTLNRRNDYSKTSRTLRHVTGWFLVVEKTFNQSDAIYTSDFYQFELYHVSEQYWEACIVEVGKKGWILDSLDYPILDWLPQD